MAEYRATTEIPPLVAAALRLAERLRFPHSSRPETGRLLRVLAAQARAGTIAEIGTGCGVGAAWIADGLRPGVSFVTVEIDETLAAAARPLFAGRPAVEVVHGDWREIAPRAPFALLFADGGKAKATEPEALLTLLDPGGMILLDDLTPEEHWPPEWRGRPDPVREFWLNHPDLHATELLLTPRSAVILATRAR